MFENKTFDYLLAEGKAQVRQDMVTDEGSLIHNAIAALAFELEKFYIELDWALKQSDPAAADYESLVTMAAARAIYPKSATAAIMKIKTNAACPIGTRFRLAGFTFVSTALIPDADNYSYAAECETPGSAPDTLRGTCVLVDYVPGVTSAEIVDLLTAGENAETKEALYQRYIDSFTSSSFAGNITAYKTELVKIPGVGGAKVYPVWDGPGTVKCVVISSDDGTVSEFLLQQIKSAFDPESGDGYGLAPIGHIFTVASVAAVTINIVTSIEFRSGYSWATCEADIKAAIERYLASTRHAWSAGTESDYITVYISRLEAAVLDVEGIRDISGTTINGEASNLVLASDEIPVLGEVVST
ncbi:MAG: baseplate J/gp47 family protein [Eubacterium sp.]|nr:baseplate J/gp47 family protein [Candidatus Colimonas fimequi]